MPLSTLRPIVTQRFHEIDVSLTYITATESTDPLVPDGLQTRIMRGMFYVHLYGAFEYVVDQTFIRIAQHISSKTVSSIDLNQPIFSVALDPHFTAIQSLLGWQKKYKKRIEIAELMVSADPASIRDNVLSPGMQSIDSASLAMAFDIYGIKSSPFFDLPTKTYVDEVVSKRHAVAHGRESPTTYGNEKVSDLRRRYNALNQQASYILDAAERYLSSKEFVISARRATY